MYLVCATSLVGAVSLSMVGAWYGNWAAWRVPWVDA